MEILELINYLKWADDKIFGIIASLDEASVIKEYPIQGGSIYSRVLHLAEEYTAWLYDIQDRDWKEVIKKIQDMKTKSLIEHISELHKNWSHYIESPPKTVYSIDEGDGLIVSVTLDEVVFNLVNHASYHRGQIVAILRMMDIETPITDWYWFKISKIHQ